MRSISEYLKARKLRNDGMDVVVKRKWQELEFFAAFDRPINEKAAMKMMQDELGSDEPIE